jgi:hypothetical protein
MNYAEVFAICVLAVIILLYIKNYYGEVEYVTARSDGRRYLVRKLRNRQAAADMLASLNAQLTRLVHHMAAKHPDDADVQRLFENYNPDDISEGGAEIGYTSYSVNKGEKLVLCIRQKDNTFVDENTVMYVAVHELGHLMTDEIGHTDKFWANFRWLLKEAIQVGLYKRVDFALAPRKYCGITISSSVI